MTTTTKQIEHHFDKFYNGQIYIDPWKVEKCITNAESLLLRKKDASGNFLWDQELEVAKLKTLTKTTTKKGKEVYTMPKENLLGVEDLDRQTVPELPRQEDVTYDNPYLVDVLVNSYGKITKDKAVEIVNFLSGIVSFTPKGS